MSRSSYGRKHTSPVATTEAPERESNEKGASGPGHLLVSLGELLQIVFQEADLLFVGGAALGILRVQVILYSAQFDFSRLEAGV